MKRVTWIMACLTCVLGMRTSLGQDRDSSDLQSKRARLEAMSDVERARFREFIKRMKELPEGERSALQRRAKHLGSMQRRVYSELDPKTRERIDKLDPRRRRELLKDMVREEADESGQRLLHSLPESTRKRLEEATPVDRERYLREFRRRGVSRGLVELGSQMGVDKAELDIWKAQPEEARRARFLELTQRKILFTAKAQGLPKGIDADLWRGLAVLPASDFVHSFRRLSRSYPELESWLRDKPDKGSAHSKRTRRHGKHRRPSRGIARLTRAMRLSAEVRLELAELPQDQQIAEQDRRRRAAAAIVMQEEQLLDPQELVSVEALRDADYLSLVRSKVLGWKESSTRRREFRRHSKRRGSHDKK